MEKKKTEEISHAEAFKGRLSCGIKTALLVVDVVVAYIDPGSPLFLPETGISAFNSNLRLAEAARAARTPVILTNVEYDALGQNGGYFFKKVPGLKSFVKGSALGAFPENLRQEGDHIVTKQYASAFFGTSLAPMLRSMGVDTVVITGFSTSGCVRATAIDAIQHDFIPFIVSDACADRSSAQHGSNLSDISAKYGEVISEQEALDILGQ